MKNWKTSLIGALGGLLTAYASGGFHDVKLALPGIVLALLGLVSKDADK